MQVFTGRISVRIKSFAVSLAASTVLMVSVGCSADVQEGDKGATAFSMGDSKPESISDIAQSVKWLAVHETDTCYGVTAAKSTDCVTYFQTYELTLEGVKDKRLASLALSKVNLMTEESLDNSIELNKEYNSLCGASDSESRDDCQQLLDDIRHANRLRTIANYFAKIARGEVVEGSELSKVGRAAFKEFAAAFKEFHPRA